MRVASCSHSGCSATDSRVVPLHPWVCFDMTIDHLIYTNWRSDAKSVSCASIYMYFKQYFTHEVVDGSMILCWMTLFMNE